MLKRRQAELDRRARVGLAVLAVIALVITLGVVKPNPFHHPTTVRVVFDDATGLSLIQRDVRVAGVKVGRIGDVRRVGDDAEVELLLDEDVGTVHRDARASLRPHTPFEGTTFVDLELGSPSAPPLGDGVIPRARTTTYVSLDQALRAFDRPARGSVVTVVDELARAFTRPGEDGLRRSLQALPPLLRDTSLAVRAVRGPRGDELRTLVPALTQTADALAAGRGRLGRTVANLRATLDAVAVDDAAPVDATLARLPATLTRVRRASADAGAVLDGTEALTRAARPALDELPATARTALTVLPRLRPDLAAAGPGLADLRRILAEVVRGAPALRAALGSAGSAVRRLGGSALPQLAKDSRYGLPGYLQALAGFTGLTGVLSGYQTTGQTDVGVGHALRATLDLPTPIEGPGKDLTALPCSFIARYNEQFATGANQLGICTP